MTSQGKAHQAKTEATLTQTKSLSYSEAIKAAGRSDVESAGKGAGPHLWLSESESLYNWVI